MTSLPFDLSLYCTKPDSEYAEAIRTTRTNILRHITSGRKILLVTSTWEGEGKSTTCLSLAPALAEVPLKVLLIDGDLRQRSLTAIFQAEGPGLDQIEAAEPSQTRLPNIAFVPAGKTKAKDPAQLITSATLANWLRVQKHHFDVIMIDTPPLSACKDAFLWAPMCDGAVLIASRQKFRGLAEGHLSEDLREEGIEVLGVILTG